MGSSGLRGFSTRVAVVALGVAVGASPSAAALGAPDAGRTGFAPPTVAALTPLTTPVESASLIATRDVSALVPPSIDPAGITYLSHADRLLFSDSEVDEEPTVFTGANLFDISRSGVLAATGLAPDVPMEPTGLAYDPATRHIFISNDNAEQIYRVDPGADGRYGSGDDVVTSFSTAAFGSTDPEDVAFDVHTGALFVADGIHAQVFRIDPGPNGVLEGAAGDDLITSFPVGADGVDDAEGLEYRAQSRTLLVVDAGSDESIFEYTTTGVLLRRIDLDVIQIVGVPEGPSDVAIAPASSGSGASHLYVVDRKADNGDPNDAVPPPLDGTIYELSAPFADLPPVVDAGPDRTTSLSAVLSLSGLAVDDGQPAPVAPTVEWTKTSGPGDVVFGSATATSTTATFSVVGTYELALTASDTVSSTSDPVTVTVVPDPVVNAAPSVSAGPDRTAFLGSALLLTGAASDDGLPDPPASLTYQWATVSGPGSATFGASTTSTTSVSFSTTGVYELRLTVGDGQLEASDTLQVTVMPAPPQPPTCSDEEFTGSGFRDLAGLSPSTLAAIDCLVFLGITTGTSATTFSPAVDVSRWQMALFLTRQARLQGIDLPSGANQGFTDIGHLPTSTRVAVNQLAQLGITQGVSPTEFDPDAPVSRWQMALFLVRLLETVGATPPAAGANPFTDLDGTSQEAIEAISRLRAVQIALGTSATTFDPDGIVVRWQMALFLFRTLEYGGIR